MLIIGRTYSVCYHAKDIVAEEAKYEIDDLVDRTVIAELSRRLGIVLHCRFRSLREQPLVIYHADEVTIHIPS